MINDPTQQTPPQGYDMTDPSAVAPPEVPPVTAAAGTRWDLSFLSPVGGATAGYSKDPQIRLRQMIGNAKSEDLTRKRTLDEALTPSLLKDKADADASRQRIEAQIQEALLTLNKPLNLPTGGPQMNQGEILTAGLSLAFAPAQHSQVLSALQGVAAGRHNEDMALTLKQYGLTHESAQQTIEYLLKQEGYAVDRMTAADKSMAAQEMLSQRIDAQMQIAALKSTMDQAKLDSSKEKDALAKAYDAYYKGGSEDIRDAGRRAIFALTKLDPGPAAPPTPKELNDLAGIGVKTSQTAVNWARADELTTLTPEKARKIGAEIDAIHARSGLTDSQKALVDKRVANFDAEWKVKAADVYSNIARRAVLNAGGGKSDAKTENQEIADLNRLVGISRAQLNALPDTPGSMLRKAQLEKDIADASARVNEILQGRLHMPGGYAPVNPGTGTTWQQDSKKPVGTATPSGVNEFGTRSAPAKSKKGKPKIQLPPGVKVVG